MVIHYSQPDDWEKMNALCLNTAQMTAGSYMYMDRKELCTEQQLRYLMVFVK
jgi:urocanate hydratase